MIKIDDDIIETTLDFDKANVYVASYTKDW